MSEPFIFTTTSFRRIIFFLVALALGSLGAVQIIATPELRAQHEKPTTGESQRTSLQLFGNSTSAQEDTAFLRSKEPGP